MRAAVGTALRGEHPRAAGSVVAVMDGDAQRPFRSAPQGGQNRCDSGYARAHRTPWYGDAGDIPSRGSCSRRPNNVVFPALGGALRYGGRCAEPQRRARGRDMPLPRVASGRLGLSVMGCDRNQPSRWLRVLLAVALGQTSRSELHEDMSRRGGVAIDRHER